ncbi:MULTISPECIES: DUF3344 domain-containing protein [Streptomyces]|uniref:DUF3344 domain-containing protein n=1 Tax=Streptomyces caniscabiei TaxID=2746961 RepID=A0ABU4MR37_9ACTN|nr:MULTISPECIES: DUF3344 domain-containing protein [Streptomyces]MBE4739433.1 DUF3344 domain-containing protein [Streptomyces caniscabiei]MBE4760494.1 DUF3344 domain-containing protein [Streptomyces caniscabiei]MBE4772703.1 DUF3344 domain-containing protein [Streptomyces caniscabiei]MBE4784633.1 DUF3344 domain-containing protein [Streptomyces caniscabiei]MBE4798692.1 DUF3344 domain-containing protein [Streptomyces caniscabiei]
MRIHPGPLLRRAWVGCFTLVALCGPGAPATAAPPAPSPEAERLALTQRYRALQHGGIVRAANSSITCRARAADPQVPQAPVSPPASVPPAATPSCAEAREGRTAVNDDFDMFYVDVDRDPNTYNSSRGEVLLPPGARVSYARLYWGGNLRVGEQKPPKDNGRVLIAEPGGAYKEVLADSVVGHRVTEDADAFQASADVTELVRSSGSGLYTVAQVNVAMGRSAAGAWGGWTLTVAYENPAEPLRHLAMWDGFDTLSTGFGAVPTGGGQGVRLSGAALPEGARGTVGLVAYDGDRGSAGDSLTVSTGLGPAVALGDAANPRDDVLNSTISQPGAVVGGRTPAYANTLGYDSDVLELDDEIQRGGDQLAFRLVSQRDAAWVGALFVAVDAKP